MMVRQLTLLLQRVAITTCIVVQLRLYSWIRENTKLIVQKHKSGSNKNIHAVTL